MPLLCIMTCLVPGARAESTIRGGSLHRTVLMLLLIGISLASPALAGGTWTPLVRMAPNSVGLMLLLSDGTVMAANSNTSNAWYRLTPDAQGSYINGTWTTLAPMINTRLYYSSQVLKDGRVFVAGGEYGNGSATGETYDPLTNTWTAAPAPGHTFSDSNSEILPDGRVLVALVEGSLNGTILFDPAANSWTLGPNSNGIHNESAWVKLPDDSVLMVDRGTRNSERYIPSQNSWVTDATVPVDLYDPWGLEKGAGLLLPNGKAFFLGSLGHTAIYTPSGSTAPGSWVAGPDIPNASGTPDAPAAMMVNGKILCAVSPLPTSAEHFPSPTTFYEYDYVANAFTAVPTTTGGTLSHACYFGTMLDLPNGTVLYSDFNTQIYSYQPDGAPLAAGKPAISSITPNLDGSFHLTGTQLNGISQGASYGDDNQMATNYPIVRLTSGGNVYYARTYNWSSTGVVTGNAPVTTEFSIPAGVPAGSYSLVVVANGIASDPVASFNPYVQLAISVAASANEADAPVTATLSATWAPGSDLTVNLTSSDSSSASVPATVVLPAGQTSVTFPVTFTDDALLNGSRSILLIAAAAGYSNGTATIAVNDNETATLSVAAPTTAIEGVGSVAGTVTVSAAPDSAVAVALTSSDPTAAQVPATVTIPAGQTSANFTITVVNDTKIDGTQPATLTAHVENWTDGTSVINVLDNENTNLGLAVSPTVGEGATGSGTVSISGTLPTALTVLLSSGNPGRLTVPASVSIPAGSTSASFTLTAPNNALTDGSASATITATASGFTSANAITTVLDNDVHHYAVSAITSQVRGVPFSVTLTAQDINGVTIASYTGTPGLSASGAGGTDSITPTATTAFVGGVWTGNVTISTFDTNVVLKVDDGSGHTGLSNAFAVGIGPLHHFAWSAVASPQAVNGAFSTTITAQDSGNNTVTSYAGTTNLSGYAASNIVITEVNPNTTDGIEFTNVSASPVNISGWTIHIYDNAGSWPAPLTAFTIPSGTTCPAGQVFSLLKNGTAPGTFPAFSYGSAITWSASSTSHVAVMLRDSTGSMVDFVCVGAASPASITSPLPIPASQWSGATVAATTSSKDYQRIGSSDGNTASDWGAATPSMGTLNSGLTSPFPPPFTPVAVSPTVSGNFVNGIWTGNLTVTQAATQMNLRADDGSGHFGDSNAFNVVVLPPVVNTLAATAVTGTTATLNGTVSASGTSATVSFDRGTTVAYGTNVAGVPSTVTGNSATSVSATLSGLTPGTTYHFRVKGVNSGGTVNGTDAMFTTLSNNATLSALSISGGAPTPGFNGAVTSYTATVSNATTSVTVTPTTASSVATVQARVNGGSFASVTSGSPSAPLPVNVGANTVDVRVTAQDGITITTYSIAVTRNTSYQDWAGGYGLSGPNAVIGADYDGDGALNLLEWAFATDPSSATTGAILVGSPTSVAHGTPALLSIPDGLGGANHFAMFGRRKDAATVGLSYIVEFSADLGSWEASGEAPTVVASDSVIDAVTVPFPATVNGAPTRFFHVRVTGP
jgi:hypothetical protein